MIIFIYIHMCIYISIHKCIYIYIHLHIHIYRYVCINISLSLSLYIYIHRYMFIFIHKLQWVLRIFSDSFVTLAQWIRVRHLTEYRLSTSSRFDSGRIPENSNPYGLS